MENKRSCQAQETKKTLAQLGQESNLTSLTSSAAIPHDTKQIANMRSAVKSKREARSRIPVHKSIKDGLYSMLIMAVEEKYTHGVTVWPEAMCIVGLPY